MIGLGRFLVRRGSVVSVDAAGTGIKEMPDRIGTACLQQVGKTHYIGIDV
jgi:hypothetical protein